MWCLSLAGVGATAAADPVDALARFGGKGRNLGHLVRDGFAVPQGFCLDTAAFRLVVRPLLADLPRRSAHQGDPATIRTLIEQDELPEAVAAEVSTAYAALGDQTPVAVRSSATAEDLDDASFAGQQDTVLQVVGAEAVLSAVRRCWGSAWSDRAVQYRADRGIPDALVEVAVVIQVMVPAVVAGVLFTANPLTGTRHQAAIEAAPGLGEALVSGQVDPDRFVVDTASGIVLERHRGRRQLSVIGLPGGGTEVRPQTEDLGAPACLDDSQLGELASAGDAIERAFGTPQDIEWAIGPDGRLWLTQARPITTLYPLVPGPATGERSYVCITLAQGLVRPITPLGQAAFRLVGTSLARLAGFTMERPSDGPSALRTAGERLFVDITVLLRHPWGRKLLLTAFGAMEARLAATVRRLVDDPAYGVGPVRPVAVLRRILPIVVRVRLPLQVATGLVSPRTARRQLASSARQIRGRVTLPPDADAGARLDLVERTLSTADSMAMPRTIGYAVAGLIALRVAQRLLGPDVGPTEAVLRGLPHNVTTIMDLELWRISTVIGADPDSRAAFTDLTAAELSQRYRQRRLPRVAQAELVRFLHRYGHRAVAEIDLGMPRWSEDPSHLCGVLSGYLRLPPEAAPDRQFAAATAEAEARVAELVTIAESFGSAWRARVIAAALARARDLLGLRETPKSLFVLTLALARHQLLLVGAHLAAAGQLASAEDVVFCDLDQLRAGLAGTDLHRVVEEHRAAYTAELGRRHIPRLLLSDGTEPEALPRADNGSGGEPSDPNLLRGAPASAGTIIAQARVVLDPTGARMEPGEILVAPSTDPGWTPLFLGAGALVMEMGGANSHGSVVAREYGLPAVVGVPDATVRITTGQWLDIDGAAGTVRLVPPPS